MDILCSDFGYFKGDQFIFAIEKADKLIRYIETGVFDKRLERILIKTLFKLDLPYHTRDKLLKLRRRCQKI